MDLIYADGNLNDIGVLKSYSIDFAFGSDENNFELTMPINNDVLQIGMYIYYPGTGYAGIIDAKKVSRVNDNITLNGRTLEGILEGAVISPDQGAAYYVANGDANAIISALITRCNLGAIFRGASEEIAQISNYNYRYDKMFSGLRKMLKTVNLTLNIKAVAGANNKTIFELAAVPIMDYSQDEGWTSDEIKVESGVYGNQVNHLLCLGGGNLAERHVIHLFCDENGIVQPYKTVANPLSDSDYILDESQKLYNGIAEIVEVYDYPSIASIDNYIMLTEQPEDWEKQELFYTKDGDTWEQVEPDNENHYKQLGDEPSAWAKNFKNYYEVVNGAYSSVGETEIYDMLREEPENWATNYADYYTYYNDGVNETHPGVKGVNQDYLVLQTMVPSDWNTNYSSYKKANGQPVGGVTAYYLDLANPAIYDFNGKKTYNNAQFAPVGSVILSDYNLLNIDQIKTNTEYGYYRYEELRSWYETLSGQTYASGYGGHERVRLSRLLESIQAINAAAVELIAAYRAYVEAEDDKYLYYDELIHECSNFQRVYAYKMEEINRLTNINLFYLVDLNDYTMEAIVDADNTYIYAENAHTVAPTWKANTYYTQMSREIAPAWQYGVYYSMHYEVPEYVVGKYYRLVTKKIPNNFVAGKYYRKLTDNYFNLVAAGIEKIAELRKVNTITANLNARREYGLGDIVAVRETITNTTANMSVAKKILSGTNGNLTISYTLE